MRRHVTLERFCLPEGNKLFWRTYKNQNTSFRKKLLEADTTKLIGSLRSKYKIVVNDERPDFGLLQRLKKSSLFTKDIANFMSTCSIAMIHLGSVYEYLLSATVLKDRWENVPCIEIATSGASKKDYEYRLIVYSDTTHEDIKQLLTYLKKVLIPTLGLGNGKNRKSKSVNLTKDEEMIKLKEEGRTAPEIVKLLNITSRGHEPTTVYRRMSERRKSKT